MSLWTGLRIIIFASQQGSQYNTAAVVLCIETVKLLLAAQMFVSRDGTFSELLAQLSKHRALLAKYFVPAFLYCIYNNLTFTVLSVVNPSTYAILQQLRLVVTGLLYERCLSRRLSRMQWIAIVLLTIGCMVKEADQFSTSSSVSTRTTPVTMYLFILLQIACAVAAGVYNEVLLKEETGTSINLQNVCMYLNSIVCNVLFMALGFGPRNIRPLFSFSVFPIILTYASIGIVTSIFLKHLNSVLKTIASALELYATAATALLLFGTPIDGFTVISLILVSGGVYIYSAFPPDPSPPTLSQPARNDDDADAVLTAGKGEVSV
ncbi:cmp-sialic acid transporter [Thecamonas trahens ATCC 50062]|uniref:Cmp-sialic acid transporter n=1 Tax=Thecamonas trahens ATCC 50062 TaxID=461836 RepID=A0A0L0DTC3_THETB|nr:cmp-sialic acid transporter [Thecamonas trahens ATCC 50062]KNC55472.1 cmp-sialic acid transporter [Thecamonas trahens ATCC 50062]|eukprot:XP_013761252.1 cmp-sialic acid transporter [Thecamonas trahens ATCC 50062]